MLFLLPPSETKNFGGLGPALDLETLNHQQLGPARKAVLAELIKLSGSPSGASALKLGPRGKMDLERNLEIGSSGTMPALDRYSGVVYEALGAAGLDSEARTLAFNSILIQSALFGLVRASDQLPYYRLSAGTRLPSINLKATWIAAHETVWDSFADSTIIDLRSKAYAQLAPTPARVKAFSVEVVDQGSNRALNHFNKKAKGALVASALRFRAVDQAGLEAAASAVGLGLEMQKGTLIIRVPSGF